MVTDVQLTVLCNTLGAVIVALILLYHYLSLRP